MPCRSEAQEGPDVTSNSLPYFLTHSTTLKLAAESLRNWKINELLRHPNDCLRESQLKSPLD